LHPHETGKAKRNVYSRGWEGKCMSDMFPIRNGLKQGDALTPLLFNFALAYALRWVQVSQDSLKLNGIHQLLIHADDVNTLRMGDIDLHLYITTVQDR